MIHSFLRKLKNYCWPTLTITNRPKTIQSDAYSMSEKPSNQEEVPLRPGATIAAALKLNPGGRREFASEKAHKITTVICACIMRAGGQEVLLSMRRAPGVPGLHGKWELPGGKIEFGETPEQTIVREIQEELGLKVVPRRVLPYLHTNIWEYEHAVQHVVLACYECELENDVSSAEGKDVRWFHINEIDFASTLPGTKEFVSLAANNQWFDKVYIEFECLDPSTNASKWFAVSTQPTLYSKYGLVMYWGKLGVGSRSRIEEFSTPKELDVRIFETAKRRLAQGYYIRALRGPDRAPEVLTRIVELAKQKNEYRPIPEVA